ncbi:MAG: protein phosphatase CheZ [Pseudomonadota bacterium]
MNEDNLSEDSSSLEELFDSIASGLSHQSPVTNTQAEAQSPSPSPSASASDATVDSDELQALFDSVSPASAIADLGAKSSLATSPVSEPGRDVAGTVQGKIFQQVGVMARQLHDTLAELGHGELLQQTVSAIPDAKERLNYIANLTEQAACRVLNATDIATPVVDELESDAARLSLKWDDLFANRMDVAHFKLLAEETRAFIKQQIPEQTGVVKAQLMEVMMAQDFQDLTGQVIKKVIAVAQELEAQLMGILIETMPGERRTESVNSLLNGPVINPDTATDVVKNQNQVDDLLDSLGF